MWCEFGEKKKQKREKYLAAYVYADIADEMMEWWKILLWTDERSYYIEHDGSNVLVGISNYIPCACLDYVESGLNVMMWNMLAKGIYIYSWKDAFSYMELFMNIRVACMHVSFSFNKINSSSIDWIKGCYAKIDTHIIYWRLGYYSIHIVKFIICGVMLNRCWNLNFVIVLHMENEQRRIFANANYGLLWRRVLHK